MVLTDQQDTGSDRKVQQFAAEQQFDQVVHDGDERDDHPGERIEQRGQTRFHRDGLDTREIRARKEVAVFVEAILQRVLFAEQLLQPFGRLLITVGHGVHVDEPDMHVANNLTAHDQIAYRRFDLRVAPALQGLNRFMRTALGLLHQIN